MDTISIFQFLLLYTKTRLPSSQPEKFLRIFSKQTFHLLKNPSSSDIIHIYTKAKEACVMYKRIVALFLALLFLPLCALGETQKVFMSGETEPFNADECLLTLYVCPLMGSDSMLLTFEDHSMLVDMGKENQIDDILAMLTRAGVDHVEYAFNTHPHNDHIGAIPPMIGKVGIGQFMTVFPHDYIGSAIAQRPAIRALTDAGIPIVDMENGDTIEFGDVEITLLRQTDYITDNSISAMLSVRYGDCSLLLTADVEGRGQEKLNAKYDLKHDIIKFPHHGMTPMDAAFLAETAPEYVFIPHGSINTEDGQAQLDKAGIPYHFATWGPITLTTNGEKWIVEQEIFADKKEYAAKFYAKKDKK